jgi:hypothetical protein
VNGCESSVIIIVIIIIIIIIIIHWFSSFQVLASLPVLLRSVNHGSSGPIQRCAGS